ncbi:response regulator [Mangrovicoccus sp. HB161399]|uniref:response regulator n=1 Tax=Mangrovicoccus sp. HB161399 TaxID=2720392 RepID=UPI0015580914|nr:response regulator [Mangrovicoccus sp. HB161399]
MAQHASPQAGRPGPRDAESGGAERLEILLLEDERTDRMRLQRLLAATGTDMQVTACATLEDFIAAIEHGRFDLALVDRHIGGSDGLDAVPLLRRSRLNAAVPVIMVACDAAIPGVVSAMRAGCSDFLGKEELSADRLQAAIRGALGAGLAGRAPLEDAVLAEVAERVVAEVAAAAAEAVQPVLRRIYARIAALRDAAPPEPDDVARLLGELEEDCRQLWQHVDGLGGPGARRVM